MSPCDPATAPHVKPSRDPASVLALVEQVARVGHWRVDTATNAVFWSPEVYRIHGVDPRDGTPDLSAAIAAYHPDDRAQVERFVFEAVELGAPFEFNLRLMRPDGDVRHVLSRGHCEFGPCGAVSALFGVMMDVTETRRAEQAAKEARALAEAANEAKTEFLASMSHEIRTPLNSILGFADLLIEQEGLDVDQRRLAERIQSAGAALRTVVDDILDFSEIESGKVSLEPQRFELELLIDDALSIAGGLAAKKGLDLRVSIAPQVPRALIGDQDRLRQVLLNLLNNAVKFTPSGAVTLSVACPEATPNGARLVFAVSDTGIGIAADRRERLFKRFSQLDGSVRREFGGSGLGLAISKTLIELMGGEITVESAPGEGSTFRFGIELPAAGPVGVKKHFAIQPGPARHAKILLVEDLEINQELACAVLQGGGHAVDVVSDGADAVTAVQAKSYDLVLMDIHMPGMDGIEATRLIRALDCPARSIPIIAMTANVLPAQVAKFLEAGMDDHVGKPFKRADLFRVIERWIAEAPLSEPSDKIELEDDAPVDPLDAQRFSALEEMMGRSTMAGFLRRLAGEIDTRLSDLKLAEQDLNALAHEAHAIVSSAGMLGYSRLSTACSRLELVCREGRRPTAELDDVRAERDMARADCVRRAAANEDTEASAQARAS